MTRAGAHRTALVRHHQDLLLALFDDRSFDATVRQRERPAGTKSSWDRLVEHDVLERLRWEEVDDTKRGVYRLRAECRATLRELVADRDTICPCGHRGVRNLRDGGYTCLFAPCDREFTRDELAIDTDTSNTHSDRELLTDGGHDRPATAGDLPADRTVYRSPREHAHALHLDPDCRYISGPPRECRAGTQHDDHALCRRCTGRSQAHAHGGDGRATRKRLLETDPERLTDGGDG